MTPAEVATMFRVDPKTVTRRTKAGSRVFHSSGQSVFVLFRPVAAWSSIRMRDTSRAFFPNPVDVTMSNITLTESDSVRRSNWASPYENFAPGGRHIAAGSRKMEMPPLVGASEGINAGNHQQLRRSSACLLTVHLSSKKVTLPCVSRGSRGLLHGGI